MQGERAAVVTVRSGYEPPTYEVIALDCEITAYAPDDEPLF